MKLRKRVHEDLLVWKSLCCYVEDFLKELTEKIQSAPPAKKRMAGLTAALLICTMCFGTVAFAWLAISRTPLASDLGLTVMAQNRLELAFDEDGEPGEWQSGLDFSEKLSDVVGLKPCTWSKKDNCFYAASYDIDGRVNDISSRLSDTSNASVHGKDNAAAERTGYYISETIWVRSDSKAMIDLSEAAEVDDGIAGTGTYVIGNPIWSDRAEKHVDGGNGLETAVRVGFLCEETDLEGYATGQSRFVVYEPNCDSHVDGSTGYQETMSKDGGTGLVSDEDLIRQSTSSWGDTSPITSGDVLYSMGDFLTDTGLFEVTPESLWRVTIYVWLEGQDVDCVDEASADEVSILVNLQLKAEDTTDTGIIRD